MNPESVHFLWDLIDQPNGGLMIASSIVAVPIGFLFFYWVSRHKVHPMAVWLVLSILCFGGSQFFREKRTYDQRFQLMIAVPIECAVLTWILFRFTSLKNRKSS